MRHAQWEPPLLGLLWCLKPCQPVLCSSWGLLAPWKLLRKTWNSTWNTLKIVSFSEVIFGDRHSCWTKRIMSVVSDPCLDWKKIFKWFQIQTFTINIYIYMIICMHIFGFFLSSTKGCLKRWGPVGLGLTGFIWWFQIFLMKLWRTEVLLFCCRSKVLTSWLRHFKRRPGMRTSLQLLSHNLEGVCCLTHKKTSKS